MGSVILVAMMWLMGCACAHVKANARWRHKYASIQHRIGAMKREDEEGKTITVTLQACPQYGPCLCHVPTFRICFT